MKEYVINSVVCVVYTNSILLAITEMQSTRLNSPHFTHWGIQSYVLKNNELSLLDLVCTGKTVVLSFS